jgi:hypothetical protein
VVAPITGSNRKQTRWNTVHPGYVLVVHAKNQRAPQLTQNPDRAVEPKEPPPAGSRGGLPWSAGQANSPAGASLTVSQLSAFVSSWGLTFVNCANAI